MWLLRLRSSLNVCFNSTTNYYNFILFLVVNNSHTDNVTKWRCCSEFWLNFIHTRLSSPWQTITSDHEIVCDKLLNIFHSSFPGSFSGGLLWDERKSCEKFKAFQRKTLIGEWIGSSEMKINIFFFTLTINRWDPSSRFFFPVYRCPVELQFFFLIRSFLRAGKLFSISLHF